MAEIISRPYATAFEKLRRLPTRISSVSRRTSRHLARSTGSATAIPTSFVSLGMAEQNMMSFAGGLGIRRVPAVSSFLRGLSISPPHMTSSSPRWPIPRRRVRLMGFLPGITTPWRDDAPGDRGYCRDAFDAEHDDPRDRRRDRGREHMRGSRFSIDGPVYCRVLRGTIPRLFETPVRGGPRCANLSIGQDVGARRDLGHSDRGGAARCGRHSTERAFRCGTSISNTIKPFDRRRLPRSYRAFGDERASLCWKTT
jgi:transketolase